MKTAAFSLLFALALAAPAAAQEPPQPTPYPPPVAPPRDVDYPGVIALEVDATDLQRRIFRVRETIPVAKAGPLTLLYPAWLPGNHAPRGPIDKLAGLTIRAGGKVLAWRRDPVDVYAFHIDVPAETAAVEVEFQFVSPTASDQGRVVMTPEMLNLQWNAVALYPAGYFARRIQVDASVRLPDGWRQASALTVRGQDGGLVRFQPTDFDTLVDSPIFAGRHFRQVELAGGANPVRLNIVADRPELLAATDAQLEAHRELVRQADRLYGARHYDHYDFLLALTERMGGIGLEHHRSSENGTVPNYFTAWETTAPARDLLAHEYTHSWNGKHRRPADLWTANFNVPMRADLLWVYEGQTQFWGQVLAARSGLISRQDAMDSLAMTAAVYQNRVGRQWRSVEDTTFDPVTTSRRPIPWVSWQRSEDYYSEGLLVWLEADTLIRELSGEKRSLDDFAKAFFGGASGKATVSTYVFEDVVRTLNAVQPYDWAKFLTDRIDEAGTRPPLAGLEHGGYRLTYVERPSNYFRDNETRRRIVDLTYSIGLTLNSAADIVAVQWDGPAFQAGLAVGGKVMAVNGVAYDTARLKEAITAAKAGAPLELLVKNGDHFRTFAISWRGGLRYPKLERIQGVPARLDAIYAPRGR